MDARFEDEFIIPVRDWCLHHADKVSKCYTTTHQGYPSVFVISSLPKRDVAVLGQPLAALSLNLQRRGWICNVLQIPGAEAAHYDAYFEAEQAILVYGGAEVYQVRSDSPHLTSREQPRGASLPLAGARS
jgi:hypothetical protein